jgi:hypothetical protein
VDPLSEIRKNSPIYVLLFCWTRLSVAYVIVYFSQAWAQVFATILVIQTTVTLQGWIDPFRHNRDRKLEFFNQAITFNWCYFMFIFTQFVPNAKVRFMMGYLLIAMVTLCYVVNLVYANSDLLYRWKKWRQK